MALLDGCKRYKPDPDQRQNLWEAERSINQLEAEAPEGLPAM